MPRCHCQFCDVQFTLADVLFEDGFLDYAEALPGHLADAFWHDAADAIDDDEMYALAGAYAVKAARALTGHYCLWRTGKRCVTVLPVARWRRRRLLRPATYEFV